MKKTLLGVCTFLAANAAWPHPGHGMPGAVHWHATDVAGLVFVAVAALAAIWLSHK